MPSPIFLAATSLLFAVLAHGVQSNPAAPAAAVACASILSLGTLISAFRSAS